MRSLLPALPLALLLIAAAGPEDAALEDARCLLAIGQLAGAEDEMIQRAGQLGSQYYFGRLDGRAVPDLEALLKKAAATMKPEELDSTIQRCGATMQARGQTLQAIGERMTAEAEAEASQ